MGDGRGINAVTIIYYKDNEIRITTVKTQPSAPGGGGGGVSLRNWRRSADIVHRAKPGTGVTHQAWWPTTPSRKPEKEPAWGKGHLVEWRGRHTLKTLLYSQFKLDLSKKDTLSKRLPLQSNRSLTQIMPFSRLNIYFIMIILFRDLGLGY